MKKLLAVLLTLALLCASLSGFGVLVFAESSNPALDYAQNILMATPETTEQKFNLDSLNLLVSTGGDPVITWTDSANSIAYAITGAQSDMLKAYTDMVFLSHWDTCALFVDNERVLVYDHTENGTKESAATYEEYADAVVAYFFSEGNEADADPDSSERDYVLNKNSKKFHLPSCASVDQIKSKNRQDYHGTRDDLIARGYEPCGRCNP